MRERKERRERREREILRALAGSADVDPPRELDALVRSRLAQHSPDPLLEALADSAEAEVPRPLDAAVRARIASWRPARRRVPTLLPLGVAAASVVTLFAGLAAKFGEGGQLGYEGAALAISAYLALSAVTALPILMLARRRPVAQPAEARS